MEEKEEQRAYKETHCVKRRAKNIPKFVEGHSDDLGDDLSALGAELDFPFAPVVCEVCEDSVSEEDEHSVSGLQYWALSGPGGDRERTRPTTMHLPDVWAAIAMFAQMGPGIDIVEFCGGEGRATKIAIRRRLKAGRNFDVVAQADLGDPATQSDALRDLDDNNVLVLVMGPSCRTLGPPCNLNVQINYDT